ncbi:MarR family winged helix-turn-helix transcriptional regulator [Bacillus badius]|uniref:HTH-type transcriptional regulator MgrA n=1 Tax=Bacillus badius TaxID=1455 RepID=A0ABR5AR26_BACBA|nr:MarR family transcriptional regulator [Bacillus badius]KIL77202.1 Transcriptional regulator, MarR family [Bacillus badius]KZO01050.1 MarR family transcriptional regulator [Bacillus badius]MED0668011.1 MarR family transcriptional regulator [Bacillus badius]MED4717567.1 MarR family transcriptional regulator [Bacillus badius]OCS89102.1 MarR family transcriptional regulator [Bacillus badius]
MNAQFINEAWTDLYYYLHYQHEESLTHQNIRCMQAVKKNKDATIQFLSDALQVTHHTASEHVKRLIQKGYLKKERSLQDKRIVYVKLTGLGEDVLKRNTELDEEKLQTILERVSAEERQKIIEAFSLLRKEAKDVFSR